MKLSLEDLYFLREKLNISFVDITDKVSLAREWTLSGNYQENNLYRVLSREIQKLEMENKDV